MTYNYGMFTSNGNKAVNQIYNKLKTKKINKEDLVDDIKYYLSTVPYNEASDTDVFYALYNRLDKKSSTRKSSTRKRVNKLEK